VLIQIIDNPSERIKNPTTANKKFLVLTIFNVFLRFFLIWYYNTTYLEERTKINKYDKVYTYG
jgi:hypothetical protein